MPTNIFLGINWGWKIFFDQQFDQTYFKELISNISENYKTKEIYPRSENIFRCFKYFSPENIKVVIIGQDPYHGINQADGLAFSSQSTVPPSLRNIFKELKASKVSYIENPNLERWAKQGVLLINRILTVESSKPGSHYNIGWEQFCDNLFTYINKINKKIIYIILGNKSKEIIKLLTSDNSKILISSHPSPYSANKGFLGSNIFKKANELLEDKKIEW